MILENNGQEKYTVENWFSEGEVGVFHLIFKRDFGPHFNSLNIGAKNSNQLRVKLIA